MGLPVVYVTPYFPAPETWRGGFCYDEVKALLAAGEDVRVFYASPVAGGDYEYAGVRVRRFRHRLGYSAAFPWLFAFGNRRRFAAALEREGLKPGAFTVHATTAACADYAAGGIVHFQQSGRPLTFDCGRFGYVPVVSELIAAFYRRAISRAAKLVFDSHAQLARYERYEGKVADGRWEVRHNPVDRSLFCPGERPAHPGTVLGCVANFFGWKRQRDLLAAFATLYAERRDVKLVFVGSGPTLAECRQLASHLPPEQVVFRGEMDHRELPAFYRSLDLLVLPSEGEAFGSVCAEAYACGTPFAVSSDAGAAEILSEAERAALTFPPGDVAALTRVLRNFLDRREGRA